MSRLVLSRSLCLASVCGLWSCSKPADTPVTQNQPAAPAQQAPAAAPAQAQASNQLKVEKDAQGNQILRVNPEQAEKLADQFMAKGQLRQAAELLTRVISLNPKSTSAYVKRAAIMAESKLLTQAISDMSKAITLAPDNARFRNTRGYFHLSQQAYEPAIQDFSDAIGLDANFSQAHNNRGLCRVAMKQYEAGIKDFDQALKIDGKYIDAHNNKGYALMSMEKFPEAIVEFTAAIGLNPKYFNAWNNRGQAHLKLKQAEKAIADFSEAIKLVPGNLTYLSARAEAYALAGKAAEAQADRDRASWLGQLARLTQQVQQLPKQPAPWIARGRHLLTGGEHKPALNDFQRAIQLSPDHVEANCGRAATLLAMRQTDDAIGACNVILAKSASAVAASIRADAYFQKGMLDEAINDYAMAKRRDSQVAKAHRMRAEKLRSAGQAAQAEADLAMAAELDPSSNAVRQVSNEVPAPK